MDNRYGGNEDGEADNASLDTDKFDRMVWIVFERCYIDRQYGHALGIAVKARETSMIQELM